jgi:hypothetical protein
MDSLTVFGTRFIVGDADPPPNAHNENFGVASSWETPAEALQGVRSWRRRLGRELAADARLWACPKHRLKRTIWLAMERCALWQYYRFR